MSAIPLKLSISPDPDSVQWAGRNHAPVTFTVTNNDTRTVKECRLCVVRADLMPLNSMQGEAIELKLAAGEQIITDGWLQARLIGGTWQAVDDWQNALALGELAPAANIAFEVKLAIPDVMQLQGKTSFALMIAATDLAPVIPLVAVFYDDFESYEQFTLPPTFQIYSAGAGVEHQIVYPSATTQGNVFNLRGSDGMAADIVCKTPLPTGTDYTIDALVRPIGGLFAGAIRLFKAYSWSMVADCQFVDGVMNVLAGGSYEAIAATIPAPAHQWHRVTMVVSPEARTYSVYFNKVLLVADVGMHPWITADKLWLTAGNIGSNDIYFDNVGIYVDQPLARIWED